ncbi:MAG: fatty acid desaturase [Sandaracinaceae bacterium]|nr:fatty acid desaturase [Sandaracinaceae bacterium]MDW8247074.1 fatty acid desaturase [Sandaracinaceae bacterium]
MSGTSHPPHMAAEASPLNNPKEEGHEARESLLASHGGASASQASEPGPIDWWGAIPWVLCHLAVLAVVLTGITWQSVIVCAFLYVVRIFGVTAGYHRYFSHRAYKTSRWFQFVLAWLAQSSAQKSVLWWAAHHRHHHLHSDGPEDRHSPVRRGFWEAHIGWIFRKAADATDLRRVADLAKYPELLWLHRYWLLPPIVLAVVVFLLFGWSGLVVGFFLSTVLTWHATYSINSLSHVWGTRRFETKDASRNNFLLALITLGEGWHNNHHRYMNAARCGFYPSELDLTYLGLRLLEFFGIVWDLKPVPEAILNEGRKMKRMN